MDTFVSLARMGLWFSLLIFFGLCAAPRQNTVYDAWKMVPIMMLTSLHHNVMLLTVLMLLHSFTLLSCDISSQSGFQ